MKNDDIKSFISFQNIINIAMNEPKFDIISKFKLLNIVVLNKFLNKNMCPELDIGKGSVRPCIIPKIIYVNMLFMIISFINCINYYHF